MRWKGDRGTADPLASQSTPDVTSALRGAELIGARRYRQLNRDSVFKSNYQFVVVYL